MPKNNIEKKEGPELADEEKRAEEERLEQEQKEPKQIGWEKFEARQRPVKEMGQPTEDEKRGEIREEAELRKEREGLDQAYQPELGEKPQDAEKEAERLIKETEDELKISLVVMKESVKELSDGQVYNFIKDFYLNKLGYQVKHKGILGGKARIFNKKEGKYIPDDRTGKPVEFKKVSSPKGETPLLKFLKEKYEGSIRDGLTKGGPEKNRPEKDKEDKKEEDLGGRAIKDLNEAWEEQEEAEKGLKNYIEQNLPEKLKEKGKEWQEEIGKARTSKGEELTAAEKRSLERNLCLEDLPDHSIKYEGGMKGALRGFFTGKEKVIILRNGKPVERDGKPLEFKVNWYWRHPGQDMIEFLKNTVEENLKGELKKELEERMKKETEERNRAAAKAAAAAAEASPAAEEIAEPVIAQEGEAELEKKPLTQAEFFSRYLSADDLDEKDITPAKLQELQQNWKAYRKEMGIERTEIQTGKKATGKRKGIKVEAGKASAEKEKTQPSEPEEKQIPPAIIKKLTGFFKGLEKDPRIVAALRDLMAGETDLAEQEISRMLENTKKNLRLEAAKDKKNPRIISQHEDHIERLEGFLQEIRSSVVSEETGMTEDQLAEVIEFAINKGNAKKEKGETEEK